MYSEKIIIANIAEFARREGWEPEYHSYEEVQQLIEDINKLVKIDYNSRGGVVELTRTITEKYKNEVKRKVVNEQVLCGFDCGYFEANYAFVCDEEGKIFKFRPRLSQQIYNAVVADFDERQVSIELLVLKARQTGITTQTAIKFMHRMLFVKHTQAIMASVKHEHSQHIKRIQDTTYENCPWWLVPGRAPRGGFDNGSILSIQSGMQATGLGQGRTPVLAHVSEIGDVPNQRKSIEEGLMRAMHISSALFLVLEGTGAGNTGWLADKWRAAKTDFPKGDERLCPVFISWPCCPEIYPKPGFIDKFPVPEGFMSKMRVDATRKHVARCEAYIRNTPYLSRIMGHNWTMPPEQQWFWQWNYLQAVKTHSQKTWMAQMPCVTGDSRVSCELGIIPIEKAQHAKRCESGMIAEWAPRGVKPTWKLKTKSGRSLRATEEHLVQLADGDWKTMGHLKPGERIALRAPRFAELYKFHRWRTTPLFKCERIIDEDMGRLLGYFMGDGCFHQQELDIACDARDEDTIADVDRVIFAAIGRHPFHQKVGGTVRLRLSDQHWLPFLRSMGAVQPVIHSTLKRPDGWRRKVCVPECIFESPKPVVREFLRSLFECDGTTHRDKPWIELCSSHDDFLRDVQALLLGFGINGRLGLPGKTDGSKVRGAKRWEYTKQKIFLRSAFVNRFFDDIGFVSARKQLGGKRRISEKYADNSLVDEVESVVSTGRDEEVFDLRVPATSSFSANGIAVHNCDDFESLVGEHDSVFDPEIMAEVESHVYEIQTDQKIRKTPLKAYAITGDSIEEEFYPTESQIDDDEPVIRVEWRSHIGKKYVWEMIPLREVNEEKEIDTFDKLLVYEEPTKGFDYSCGIDTAYGLGEEDEDRTVVSIWKNGFGLDTDDQCCELTSNRMNSAQIVGFAACTAAWYSSVCKDWRGVKFAIEQITGPGDTCQNQLKMMGFNYHHRPRRYDSRKVKDESKRKEGWYSTGWSVPMLMTSFINAVNGGLIRPKSKWLIEEMRTLERHITSGGKTKMEHRSGQHDDRVRAAAQAFFTVHDLDDLAERAQQRRAQPARRKVLSGAGVCKSNAVAVSEDDEWQ